MPIKYRLTYVTLSSSTRRRIGKSKSVVIETSDGVTPLLMESTFERTRNALNKSVVVKVFDTRVVE